MTEAKKRRILIVDDEKALSDIIEAILQLDGYDVVKVSDGIQALEKLNGPAPDLVILDVCMPRMGGISVYHHLCQTGLKSKIPVIVLTARSGLKELFEDLEVDGFLSKPFEMEVLREKVRLILNRQDEKQPPKPIVRRRSDAADPIALSKGCMVLFEDNLSTAETITVALQEEGIKILRAASVLQGIQLISRENPFLIAISRQIAELPGDLVAYKIKKMPQGEAAAIYLYGGQDDEASGGSQDVRPVCERMGVRFIAEHGGVSSLIFEAKRVLRDLPANS